MQSDMDKALEVLSDSIKGIRSGTVSTGIVDSVKVKCYDQMTPIKFVAHTTKEGDIITVDPYDTTLTNAIAKTLCNAGFSAYAFSKTRVVVSVPPPSGEQKQEIANRIKKIGEEAKVSIRNIRKKFRQRLDKEESKMLEKQIQSVTDDAIEEVNSIIRGKIEKL